MYIHFMLGHQTVPLSPGVSPATFLTRLKDTIEGAINPSVVYDCVRPEDSNSIRLAINAATSLPEPTSFIIMYLENTLLGDRLYARFYNDKRHSDFEFCRVNDIGSSPW
jgi:hypothetical protein